MLIDHKNPSVFFQAVSGKSSWSFSYRWTQYQWEKTTTKHSFIALLARDEKNKDRKLALVGKFLIKFSSLSAPTKIEELTAGSYEKTQRSPAGNRTQDLAVFRLIRLSVLLSLSELKEKRIWKTRMFFRLFFRFSAHFRPHSCAIFHSNTHIIFCCPLSAYDKWWFEQKNNHIFEKSIYFWATLRPYTPLQLHTLYYMHRLRHLRIHPWSWQTIVYFWKILHDSPTSQKSTWSRDLLDLHVLNAILISFSEYLLLLPFEALSPHLLDHLSRGVSSCRACRYSFRNFCFSCGKSYRQAHADKSNFAEISQARHFEQESCTFNSSTHS